MKKRTVFQIVLTALGMEARVTYDRESQKCGDEEVVFIEGEVQDAEVLNDQIEVSSDNFVETKSASSHSK